MVGAFAPVPSPTLKTVAVTVTLAACPAPSATLVTSVARSMMPAEASNRRLVMDFVAERLAPRTALAGAPRVTTMFSEDSNNRSNFTSMVRLAPVLPAGMVTDAGTGIS